MFKCFQSTQAFRVWHLCIEVDMLPICDLMKVLDCNT
jgi:hypothetical protein